MKDWETNLQTRKKETWGDLFTPTNNTSLRELTFLLSPSDQGVIRNGGRRGSKHGPNAILNQFKKFVRKKEHHFRCYEKTVTSELLEKNDFNLAQQKQNELIAQALTSHSIHLGGGHDHVYPFAQSIAKKHQHLHIINIDAHLDTRQDHIHHSGTPFRQLQSELGERLSLTQVGIHASANGEENYQGFPMHILTMTDLENPFDQLVSEPTQEDTALLLSIDCDGIDASLMPAVSAVNPRGLERSHLTQIANFVRNYWRHHQHLYLGIYEFNPVFDHVSATSAKLMANYILELVTHE